MSAKIKYGSVIYLRHISTNTLLKSLPKPYCHPGTSGQQMIVASLQKSDETRWLVKGPHNTADKYAIGEEVRHGDKIRLEHISTKRNLHSHDAPSPLSNQQEVTCFGTNGGGDGNDDWIVDLEGNGLWIFDQEVRLIHVSTSKALHSHAGYSNLVFTAGEQEVTAVPKGDRNDLWIVAAEDQPPLNERIKLRPPSKGTLLNLLSIVGSIASITGWTLFTLGKTFQTTTFTLLISYVLSSMILLGALMIVLSKVLDFHLRMTANPRPFLWRLGFWFITVFVVLALFILLWRLIAVFTISIMSHLMKWALTGDW
jgi:hypothetical protein